MTLDKFGRHLLKRSKVFTSSETDTITSSKYMFYNQILSFQSDKVADGKYLIAGKVSYLFPLESATIENLRLNNDKISLIINGNLITKESIFAYPLKLNDEITFVLNNDGKTENEVKPCLYAEIIIKCYIKFENMSVSAEVAYHKQ